MPSLPAAAPFAPAPEPYPASIGGQRLWVHGDAEAAGFFHTYDALSLGPSDPPRKIHLWLPRDYHHADGRYPVVYLNDGGTVFWRGGPAHKTWDAARALAALARLTAAAAPILVAVHPIDRDVEYTHAPWAPGRGGGGALAYADYLAGRLKPHLDRVYRTRPAVEHTAVVGASHGGLSAFVAATWRPDTFGFAGCLSPSLWAAIDPVHGGAFAGGPLADSELWRLAQPALAEAPGSRPRLWIDWGRVHHGGFHNERIERQAALRGREMVGLLIDRFGYRLGSELFVAEDPLGEHDEDAWGRRLPRVLAAFLGPEAPVPAASPAAGG